MSTKGTPLSSQLMATEKRVDILTTEVAMLVGEKDMLKFDLYDMTKQRGRLKEDLEKAEYKRGQLIVAIIVMGIVNMVQWYLWR